MIQLSERSSSSNSRLPEASAMMSWKLPVFAEEPVDVAEYRRHRFD